MTGPYLFRFACLCLACFFLIHLALSAGAMLCAPWLIRTAERLRPHAAARLMLALRLFAPAGAVFAVIGFCAPSYLWLEPKGVAENLGFLCMTAALLALMIWVLSVARALIAIHGSR